MDPSTQETANGQIHLPEGISHEQLSEILGLLKGLRYGSVQIIVQDGVIVQIDRTEKKRIVKNNSTPRTSRES
jgi:hypothetical protein